MLRRTLLMLQSSLYRISAGVIFSGFLLVSFLIPSGSVCEKWSLEQQGWKRFWPNIIFSLRTEYHWCRSTGQWRKLHYKLFQEGLKTLIRRPRCLATYVPSKFLFTWCCTTWRSCCVDTLVMTQWRIQDFRDGGVCQPIILVTGNVEQVMWDNELTLFILIGFTLFFEFVSFFSGQLANDLHQIPFMNSVWLQCQSLGNRELYRIVWITCICLSVIVKVFAGHGLGISVHLFTICLIL